MSVLRNRIAVPAISVAALSVIAVLVVLYEKYDPADFVLFPKCIFHSITGLQCPGCGSQRAMHALLNLEIGEAVRYNALFVAALPFLAVLVTARAMRRRWPAFYAQTTGAPVIWTVFAVIVLWWILRNILGI